jgi:hypothetical protein
MATRTLDFSCRLKIPSSPSPKPSQPPHKCTASSNPNTTLSQCDILSDGTGSSYVHIPICSMASCWTSTTPYHWLSFSEIATASKFVLFGPGGFDPILILLQQRHGRHPIPRSPLLDIPFEDDPYLIAKPFQVSREYAQVIYDQTSSPRLDKVLKKWEKDKWARAENRQKLASGYIILVAVFDVLKPTSPSHQHPFAGDQYFRHRQRLDLGGWHSRLEGRAQTR